MENILIIFGGNESARDEKALEVLKSGKKFEHIILTGTRKEDNISKHALQRYIPKGKLWIDDKSWDTVSNTRYCNKILQSHFSKSEFGKLKIYCITNNQHFERIKTIFGIKLFCKNIFQTYDLVNLKSNEKISNKEIRLGKLYKKNSIFIVLGCFYSFFKRKIF